MRVNVRKKPDYCSQGPLLIENHAQIILVEAPIEVKGHASP